MKKLNTKGVQPLAGEDPLEKSLAQEAEAYDFTKDIREGNYLDTKDTSSIWCLAKVLKVTGSSLRIRYDSWSKRFDDVIYLRR